MRRFVCFFMIMLVVFITMTPSFATVTDKREKKRPSTPGDSVQSDQSKGQDKRVPSVTTPSEWRKKEGSGSAPPQSMHVYEITFVTGDVEGAGTDANVYITLHGDLGISPEIKAPSGNIDLFERNSWNKIYFSLDRNYGSIHTIRLRHDNTGKKPGWYVTLIRVRNLEQGGEDVFLIDRWLARDEGDGKIDITVQRSNAKTMVITPPFSREFKWTKEPGVAYAWARAYRTNGWFNFYADAFVGGSAAEAGQCADFYTNTSVPVAIRTDLTYVGGPINFGIASFSELQSRIYFNGSVNSSDIKAAFSGSTVKDKIKKVIALVNDSPDFSPPFEEFVNRMNESRSYAKLASSFQQLRNSKEAIGLVLYKTGKTKVGNNSVCATMRSNTGAVLTGSSVIIAAGIVESFEIIGVPK
ncbi:MAG: PLAT/LH2 domain-containing protein [Syntrophales bacterium]|nr:PLAT/LH2 domain-containing protein [Syntrophales bacterium]